MCTPDPGGVGPLQRHPEAVQWAARARQALQALRHEEVPEQCEQGDETPVPGQEVGKNSSESLPLLTIWFV